VGVFNTNFARLRRAEEEDYAYWRSDGPIGASQDAEGRKRTVTTNAI
jgi:hypothetical protein